MLTILAQNYGVFLSGLATTLLLAAAAIAAGGLLGFLLALGLMSRNRLILVACRVYRSFWRGTPILVQLLMLFYFLPELGLEIEPIWAAIIALALNSAAFQGEIFRSGLERVFPPGQMEAATVLGLGRWRARLRIELPQMLRLVLPALVNEAISIVKNSSLVSVIAVTELMRRSQQVAAASFQPLDTYLIAGILYLLVNLVLARTAMIAEQRLARSGALQS